MTKEKIKTFSVRVTIQAKSKDALMDILNEHPLIENYIDQSIEENTKEECKHKLAFKDGKGLLICAECGKPLEED